MKIKITAAATKPDVKALIRQVFSSEKPVRKAFTTPQSRAAFYKRVEKYFLDRDMKLTLEKELHTFIPREGLKGRVEVRFEREDNAYWLVATVLD